MEHESINFNLHLVLLFFGAMALEVLCSSGTLKATGRVPSSEFFDSLTTALEIEL